MNKNELRGGARYVGGKVEKAVGDVAESRDWQAAGVVDMVAGGAEHTYGRARSIVEDAVDAAPALAERGREALADAADRGRDALADAADRSIDPARRNGRVAADAVREQPALWALFAAAAGYTLGWLVHGRR